MIPAKKVRVRNGGQTVRNGKALIRIKFSCRPKRRFDARIPQRVALQNTVFHANHTGKFRLVRFNKPPCTAALFGYVEKASGRAERSISHEFAPHDARHRVRSGQNKPLLGAGSSGGGECAGKFKSAIRTGIPHERSGGRIPQGNAAFDRFSGRSEIKEPCGISPVYIPDSERRWRSARTGKCHKSRNTDIGCAGIARRPD